MTPIRQGDGTGLSVPGFKQVRTGDGTVVWSSGPDIPDSGVSRYRFEEDVTDSWADNDATDNTGVGYSTDSQEGSYSKIIPGTSGDVVNLPINYVDAGWDTTGSVVGWVKPADTSGLQNIISDWDGKGATLRIDAGSMEGYVYDTSGTDVTTTRPSGGNLSNDTWIHFGLVYRGSTLDLYVDGSLVDSQSANGNPIGDSPSNINVGDRGDLNGSELDGQVDLIDLYDKALSDTEVSNHYETGSIDGTMTDGGVTTEQIALDGETLNSDTL